MSSLSLNQAQLFAYAILVTQRDGLATFTKSEFEKQFNLDEYRTSYAIADAELLFSLNVKTIDDNEKWTLEHVFKRLSYDRGTFTYEWEDNFKQYIIDLKERYTRIDLSIASKFKSSYSWSLYEFLLAKYGYYSVEMSKKEMMRFFNVEDSKSYLSNTALFKKRVLDTAIDEINAHTELTVRYDEIKKGRSIAAFRLFFYKGDVEAAASDKQINYINDLLAKLKDDYLMQSIAIDNIQQSQKANNRIMQLLRIYNVIDYNKLTNSKADEIIKHLNESIKLIEKIIEDDTNQQNENDKYKDIEIPILSLKRSNDDK